VSNEEKFRQSGREALEHSLKLEMFIASIEAHLNDAHSTADEIVASIRDRFKYGRPVKPETKVEW
jgi:hypothetical protein